MEVTISKLVRVLALKLYGTQVQGYLFEPNLLPY